MPQFPKDVKTSLNLHDGINPSIVPVHPFERDEPNQQALWTPIGLHAKMSLLDPSYYQY